MWKGNPRSGDVYNATSNAEIFGACPILEFATYDRMALIQVHRDCSQIVLMNRLFEG